MTNKEAETTREELERISQQRDALKAELLERLAQIESLNQELAETNRGVVALYAELDDRAAELRDVFRAQKPLPLLYESRIPAYAPRRNPAAITARILLDQMDGPLTENARKAGQVCSELGRRVDGDGE